MAKVTKNELLDVISGLLAITPWRDRDGKTHPEVTAARKVLRAEVR